MFWIRVLPEFTDWIEGLKDATVRGVIVARINESNAV
jgi:putative component of toxin-antitoxin plasmid stabilization module